MPKDGEITVGDAKQAILRSGYLLEQRSESILETAGYYVETNAAYPDPLTGKSREIDIEAIIAFRISRDYGFIFARLICECQNNQQPVVFFVKDSPVSFLHHQDVKSAGIPVQFVKRNISTKGVHKSKDSECYISLSDFLGFEKYHHYCKGPTSTQYCTFTKKKENRPWIALHSETQHDSFTNLIFALESEVDEYYKSYVVPGKDEEESINIEIYYPVLILQGPLYLAQIENEKLELRKCKHVQYRKEYFSRDKHDTYQIDVISESFLHQYTRIIEKEMEKAKSVIKRKIKIVRESIDILTERARKKKRGESFREIFEF
jgi:hypothetical protein